MHVSANFKVSLTSVLFERVFVFQDSVLAKVNFWFDFIKFIVLDEN
jgi:hypothetical protein